MTAILCVELNLLLSWCSLANAAPVYTPPDKMQSELADFDLGAATW